MTRFITILLTTACLVDGYSQAEAQSIDPDPRAIDWPILQANLSEATAREIVTDSS